MLAKERRLSALTVEAYERDTRQFFQFLTGHCGGPPGSADVAALRPADLRGFLARRRTGGAGARTLGRGLAGIRSFLRFLERRGLANAAGAIGDAGAAAAEIAAQAADRERCQARRLDGRPACRGALDRGAQRRRADAALRLAACASPRRSSLDGGELARPGRHACCASPARAARRGWCRCCRWRSRPSPNTASSAPTISTRRSRCFAARAAARCKPAIIQREMQQAARRTQPAGHRDAACAAAFLRHASARPRRRPAHDPGTARPCQPVDDAGLYRRRYARDCSKSTTRRIRAPDTSRI